MVNYILQWVKGIIDADWAYHWLLYFFGDNPISCCGKKHQIVSRSSTEVKYRVMANNSSELT